MGVLEQPEHTLPKSVLSSTVGGNFHGYGTQCQTRGCTCVLFAKHFLSLGQLVTSPIANFTHAKVTFGEHDKQSAYRMAGSGAYELQHGT